MPVIVLLTRIKIRTETMAFNENTNHYEYLCIINVYVCLYICVYLCV